jgi:hypothetical protein
VKNDFWQYASEYWLVQNAPQLKWDFEKPDYGIDYAFKNLLEKLGIFKHKYKILVINSPSIPHLGLPSSKDNGLYIISLPFMRILDLSKLEISLLLLEDYLRIEDELFIKNIKADKKIIGKDFVNSKPDLKAFNKIISNYNTVINKEGFTFDQQFRITKKMDALLKSYPALWSQYIKLLNKIDKLVKVNLLYKNYNVMYPSPEIQIKWLSPKKEVL